MEGHWVFGATRGGEGNILDFWIHTLKQVFGSFNVLRTMAEFIFGVSTTAF